MDDFRTTNNMRMSNGMPPYMPMQRGRYNSRRQDSPPQSYEWENVAITLINDIRRLAQLMRDTRARWEQERSELRRGGVDGEDVVQEHTS